ncbi:MAG: hypothetical protein ASUL_09564 [Candidatus Aramenus sulfurataquae]|uniref:Uncharacterized protein n=1 Tax=Candidatus Aramenus sulfurataquae TaxID=1326980 RepID=W7KTB4_9CREN|nr:MAG: hypothetical protein ASUL_09564 [Candidatus Aramenus sulfurataquae]
MSNPSNPQLNTPTGSGAFSQTPTAQGGNPKPEDLIPLLFNDESVTSTFTIERLFSLKRRKFIKPYSSTKYLLQYKVLPGVYLIIYSHTHKRNDEVMEWEIMKVRIYRNEKGEVVKEVLQTAKWITPIPQSERTVPILKDIGNPYFHGHLEVDYDKVYNEEEIAQLLKGGVDPALQEEVE